MQHRELEWSAAERAATALAWLSIGLGAAAFFAPRAIARLAGIRKPKGVRSTVRALGVRELVNGAAILANPRQPAWLWSRVAGDGLDLWMMQRVRQRRGVHDARFKVASAAVMAVTAADMMVAQRLTTLERQPRRQQFLETGEIPLSDGPGLLRPQQPAADPGGIRNDSGVP